MVKVKAGFLPISPQPCKSYSVSLIHDVRYCIIFNWLIFLFGVFYGQSLDLLGLPHNFFVPILYCFDSSLHKIQDLHLSL